MDGVNWDEKKGRPNNGARYLIEQLNAFKNKQSLPYPDVKGLDIDFLKQNAAKLERLVKIVYIPTLEYAYSKACRNASEDVQLFHLPSPSQNEVEASARRIYEEETRAAVKEAAKHLL